MAKQKTIPAKPVAAKPEPKKAVNEQKPSAKPQPKPVEKHHFDLPNRNEWFNVEKQHELDGMKKKIEFLEAKAKSQSEQINLMATYCKSCEGMILEIRKHLKKVSESCGISA